MRPPAVQTALREGASPEQLQEELGIRIRPHRGFPNLQLFLYDELITPKESPIGQSCRGLVLDSSADWAVVARSFDRFFNHGEPHAASLDWGSARAQIKEDGSLATLYHYRGGWHVGTKGTADAGGELHGGEGTYAQLFWRVFRALGYRLPPAGWEAWSFVFELCSPVNRVVVRHAAPRLPLLAMRCRESGELRDPEHQPWYTPVHSFPVQDLATLRTRFEDTDPLQLEGFVVRDAHGSRLKVKHPGYVALHKLKERAVHPRTLVELVRTGESAEFVAHFPSFAGSVSEVEGRVDALVEHLEAVYGALEHLEDQKAFALAVQSTPCRLPRVIFQLRGLRRAGERREGVRHLLARVPLKVLMRALGYRGEG